MIYSGKYSLHISYSKYRSSAIFFCFVLPFLSHSDMTGISLSAKFFIFIPRLRQDNEIKAVMWFPEIHCLSPYAIITSFSVEEK